MKTPILIAGALVTATLVGCAQHTQIGGNQCWL